MSVLPPIDPSRARQLAIETLQIEADAVSALARRVDEAFAQAAQRLLDCRGRVVVMGMGRVSTQKADACRPGGVRTDA